MSMKGWETNGYKVLRQSKGKGHKKQSYSILFDNEEYKISAKDLIELDEKVKKRFKIA